MNLVVQIQHKVVSFIKSLLPNTTKARLLINTLNYRIGSLQRLQLLPRVNIANILPNNPNILGIFLVMSTKNAQMGTFHPGNRVQVVKGHQAVRLYPAALRVVHVVQLEEDFRAVYVVRRVVDQLQLETHMQYGSTHFCVCEVSIWTRCSLCVLFSLLMYV